jgi:PKD repeat protein
VAVSGNYAYVASEASNALEIVDISNKSAPVHAGSITDGAGGAALFDVLGVQVSGNYAYLASGFGNSLGIVDVSNKAAPVHAGKIVNGTYAHLDFPMGVYVSGNRAYVSCGTSRGLTIIDVSDPAKPQQEAFLGDGVGGAQLSFPMGAYVSSNYAYVAARDSNALEIVDLADATWFPSYRATSVNVTSATKIDAATIDLTNVPTGVYNVVVTNYNGEQAVLPNAFTITIAPPIAGFTAATPTYGEVPLKVKFTDTSTGSPTSWSWDFGDGTYSTEQSPWHTYACTGKYDVGLTVTNAIGSDTVTQKEYVTVITPITVTPTPYPDTNGGSDSDPAPVNFSADSKPAVNSPVVVVPENPPKLAPLVTTVSPPPVTFIPAIAPVEVVTKSTPIQEPTIFDLILPTI